MVYVFFSEKNNNKSIHSISFFASYIEHKFMLIQND